MAGSGGWLQSTISVGRSWSCPSFSSSHSSRYFSSSQVNAAVVTMSGIPASSAYICLLLLPVMRSLLLKARHRLVLCLLADSKPWFARRLIRQHDNSGNPYSHKTYISAPSTHFGFDPSFDKSRTPVHQSSFPKSAHID